MFKKYLFLSFCIVLLSSFTLNSAEFESSNQKAERTLIAAELMKKYPCLGMRPVSSLDGDNSGVMPVNTTELLEKVLSHITPSDFILWDFDETIVVSVSSENYELTHPDIKRIFEESKEKALKCYILSLSNSFKKTDIKGSKFADSGLASIESSDITATVYLTRGGFHPGPDSGLDLASYQFHSSIEKDPEAYNELKDALNDIHRNKVKGKIVDGIIDFTKTFSEIPPINDIYFFDDNLFNCIFFHYYVTELKKENYFTGNVKVIHLTLVPTPESNLRTLKAMKDTLADVLPLDAFLKTTK